MAKARGEAILVFDDERVKILFTLRVLAAAELAIGKTVTELLRAAMGGSLGVNDTVQLLRVGMEAAREDGGEEGTPITMREAWEIAERAGFSAAATAVLEAISVVIAFPGPKAKAPKTSKKAVAKDGG
ncbi:MAG TPA: hypothetical protein VM537_08070 [Anaerolineae bacterium]|nr:hypothetical protein [Anaerolineae bacterium]